MRCTLDICQCLPLSHPQARLRFADEVAMSDVLVAQELMQASKYTLENSREQKEKRRGNYISEVADIIHSLMTKNRYVRYVWRSSCSHTLRWQALGFECSSRNIY